VERILYEELQRIAREGPTAGELTKAKNIQLSGFWQSLETINGKAATLGQNEVFHGGWKNLFSSPTKYAAVTAKDVQRLARQIFDERNRTVGILLPDDTPSAGASTSAKPGAAR
jgi:predicted Zn-dependent peptidase